MGHHTEFFELWRDTRCAVTSTCPCSLAARPPCVAWVARLSPGTYAELIQAARSTIHEVAITTDIITGFPGETDAEFAECSEFVREMNFSNGHVFTFSPRAGTPAINLPNKIPPKIAKQRNATMRQIFQHSAMEYRQQQSAEFTSAVGKSHPSR